MTPQVHILATCRNPALIDATTLVFKTLRIGFPTANVIVRSNGNLPDGLPFGVFGEPVTHGKWIEELIHKNSSPFWICDTDMIFKSSVEDWFNESSPDLFAGRYEPEFFEPWTESRHVARLHPSLMWFNPIPLREAMAKWPGKHAFLDSVEKNLIRWHWVPRDGKLEFYDTCAGLHHALGGTRFTAEQNASFVHLHCGTYSDIQPNDELRIIHKLTMENPAVADDLTERQSRWYHKHKMEVA